MKRSAKRQAAKNFDNCRVREVETVQTTSVTVGTVIRYARKNDRVQQEQLNKIARENGTVNANNGFVAELYCPKTESEKTQIVTEAKHWSDSQQQAYGRVRLSAIAILCYGCEYSNVSEAEVIIQRTENAKAEAGFLKAETERLAARRAYDEEAKRALDVMQEIEDRAQGSFEH